MILEAFAERRGVSPPVGERRGVSPPVRLGTGGLTPRRSPPLEQQVCCHPTRKDSGTERGIDVVMKWKVCHESGALGVSLNH
jgi:hypothetical protein